MYAIRSYYDQPAIKLQLHIAGALELLEDNLVHLAAGIDEGRGDDRQAPSLFDNAGRPEKTLRLVQSVGIHTPGEDFSAGRHYSYNFV